ncbi:hypothetical protein K1X76_03205 [bacterium]|nr:hypothetical protein [bacterium]
MMRKISILGFFFFLYSTLLHAAPLTERLPASEGAPLSVFNTQISKLIVPLTGDFANRYIIGSSGKQITIIDTETWSEISEQPAEFDENIESITLLGDGNTLLVTLGDGNLAQVLLDDIENENDDVEAASDDDADTITDPRVIEISSLLQSSNISKVVADVDSADSVVYFIDSSSGFLYSYDIDEEELLSFELVSDIDITDSFTPNDLIFTDGSGGQKVFVAAQDGKVLVLDAGGSTVRILDVPVTDDDDDTEPDLTTLAATPDGDFVYILDNTNDAIWVLDTSSEEFVDQLTGGETVDPIRFESDENSTLSDLWVADVLNPTSTYLFISGVDGISVVDASVPDSISGVFPIVDMDDATADVFDPISLDSLPGALVASSDTDGYLYSSNGDATLSIISDNPFVTIDDASPITVTEAEPTFTLTFQTDETGTYDVKVNSDITSSSGTVLLEDQSADTADSDLTTSTIDISLFDRAVFEEGTNRVFIFVTDGDGNVGRDAVDITVDRPPGEVTITGTSFGNHKVYVSFTALTDNDISVYTLYAKEAESQTDPSCPGTLDFTTAPDGTGTVSGSCSGSCEGTISGLTNNVYYCVAMDATDNSSQTGVLSTFSEAARPELTVGAAGLLGETGCSLNEGKPKVSYSFFAMLFVWITLLLTNRAKKIAFIVLFFLLSSTVNAQEISKDIEIAKPEKKYFSFELKGALTFPSNEVVKDIYGNCCNFSGEVEFGYLYKSKLNITVAAGAGYLSGTAVGATTGTPSGDSAGLLLIPIRNNIIFRFDFMKDQIVVPYVGVGGDYVIFRESVAGDSIKGVKVGFHGLGGVAVLLNKFEDIGSDLRDSGIDDMYLTFEGRYNKIDSFKSTGLDLSGFAVYIGFLMTF